MSNIYNRRLEYEIFADGKRVLQYPKKTLVPTLALIGDTKPNLDFQTNRMLQPISKTKTVLPAAPYVPKQPVNATGLGGRKPSYIDYVIPKTKPKPIMGQVWEPNSIRESRDNVYPDGVPKNINATQQADSQYLEYLNNAKKVTELEKRYAEREGGKGRPHPDPTREEELKRLDEMLAEARYGKGPYKNIGLSAENHAKLAQKQADDIKKELADLRKSGKENFDDLVYAGKNNLGSLEDVKRHKSSELYKQRMNEKLYSLAEKQQELELPSGELDFGWLYTGKTPSKEDEDIFRKSLEYVALDLEGDVLEAKSDEDKIASEDALSVISYLIEKPFSEYTDEEKVVLRELIIPEEEQVIQKKEGRARYKQGIKTFKQGLLKEKVKGIMGRRVEEARERIGIKKYVAEKRSADLLPKLREAIEAREARRAEPIEMPRRAETGGTEEVKEPPTPAERGARSTAETGGTGGTGTGTETGSAFSREIRMFEIPKEVPPYDPTDEKQKMQADDYVVTLSKFNATKTDGKNAIRRFYVDLTGKELPRDAKLGQVKAALIRYYKKTR